MRKLWILVALLLALSYQESNAQWTQVLQLHGTVGSAAYFFNANEGLIGVGDYANGLRVGIYYTTDGGKTWGTSQLPNQIIAGQVNDIFFTDRKNGWATIKASTDAGWGGVYRSTDGGYSWKIVLQLDFPGQIRETKRGVFVTDRGLSGGMKFSSNQGKTWQQVTNADFTLGLDFLDDNTGLMSNQASGDYLYTTDGGVNWRGVTSHWESWSVFADPGTKKFFTSSEKDLAQPNTPSNILKLDPTAMSMSSVKQYAMEGLNGSIGGNKGCVSVLYVQGKVPGLGRPSGFVRSTDGGSNWVDVSGPLNRLDIRFAVTGRGAVVYAADSIGGIWKTTNGGDGKLSPSVLDKVSAITITASTSAAICDSAYATLIMRYSGCDSTRITNVSFLNDALNELSVPSYSNNFRGFAGSTYDSLRILYKPTQRKNWTSRITLTLIQPDGYLEDTTISINLIGLDAAFSPLGFAETNGPSRIDFGNVSLCADAVHKVSLVNSGCGDLQISSMRVTGPFTLKSTFKPFTLSGGTPRTFLLSYTPTTAALETGYLIVQQGGKEDTLALLGTGYSPDRQLGLTTGSISAFECDSTEFSISIRDLSCSKLHIVGVITFDPLRIIGVPSKDTLSAGEASNITVRFVPEHSGPFTDSIRISVNYDGSGAYDTTLYITGTATAGKPDIALASQSTLSDISLCGIAYDTLVFQSGGCGDITASASLSTPANGFTILRNPSATIPQGQRDTVIIQFVPVSIGSQSATLTLNTNAGIKTIPLAINVIDDPGHVALGVSQDIHAYTCGSAAFAVSVTNGTCDDITIESITLGGAASPDFALNATLPFTLSPRGSQAIDGVFSPHDSLLRDATATLHIRKKDGSSYDTVLPIEGKGVAPSPIKLVIGNVSLVSKSSGLVRVPIYALTTGTANVQTIDFTLALNTNLVTPIKVVAGAGSFGNAASSFVVTSSGAHIQLTLPSEISLPLGKLCEIECRAFVASELTTPITLEQPTFTNAAKSSLCLPTEATKDSVAGFALEPECGDSTISGFMATGVIAIERITPNPTRGEITISFRTIAAYQNDAVVEVYDPLGTLLESHAVVLNAGALTGSMSLSLNGGEGVRYIRLHTAYGTATHRIILER